MLILAIILLEKVEYLKTIFAVQPRVVAVACIFFYNTVFIYLRERRENEWGEWQKENQTSC